MGGSLREKLESERCGRAKSSVFADYDQEAIELIEGLPSKSKVKRPKATIPFTKVLLSLSDKSGRLEMKEIGKGSGVSKTLLDRNDVFILDTGSHCFVWSGAGASVDERKKAMSYAHNYLMKTEHPLVPISCIMEGKETEEFEAAFD